MGDIPMTKQSKPINLAFLSDVREASLPSLDPDNGSDKTNRSQYKTDKGSLLGQLMKKEIREERLDK